MIDLHTRWRKATLLALPALLAACTPTPGTQTAPGAGQTAGEDAKAMVAACRNGPQDRSNWTVAALPARIYGNTYYVGTCGITALLVTSEQGHALIDGGPAEAAPLVAANIAKLGFRPADVRWILSSHEHWDHVAALAELKRLTGAKVAALPIAAQVLASGKPHPDDPQGAIADPFAPVQVDRVLKDGDSIEIGALRLTVHATPSHAPGSASWTWTSCSGADCKTIAYADSATIISGDGYRFSDHPARIAEARSGLARIGALPCDILITPHPEASNLFPRMEGKAALIDAGACRAYAEAAETRFAARLAKEAGEARK